MTLVDPGNVYSLKKNCCEAGALDVIGYLIRQRLHGIGSVWNRYEIGTDKPCVYTGPGGSVRIGSAI